MHPERDRRHWHILGCGAVGSLFAHRLAAAGCPVTLLLKAGEPGLQTFILERGDNLFRQAFNVATSQTQEQPIERLLVTTKAADVDPALGSVHHRLQPGTTVLVMANGMGFAADLPHGLVAFRGSTREGAFRRHPGHTVHAGRGSTRIGLPGAAVPAPAWFTDSWKRLEDCYWDPDIDTTLWRKLAINCVINPLTAAYRCRNGELAEQRYRATLEAVCAEVASACRATGHRDAVANLFEDVLKVIHDTAANRSSMLEDVLGRRHTEIDFINGFLLRQTAVAALDLPLNRRLVTAVEEGRELHDMLC